MEKNGDSRCTVDCIGIHVSLRLRQLASTTNDYEEQIALAAALKSLKVLKEID